jgi:hypothetical protein
MKVFRVDGELTVVVVAEDFYTVEREADRQARNEEIVWNIHEVNLSDPSPYWRYFEGIPYGEPYYEDSPDLTVDEITKRYKQELEERKKQEELDKLQLKLL